MVSEKAIIESFERVVEKSYGARFYKIDLHFHTPASADARGKNRYKFNPYKRNKYREAENTPGEFYQKIKEIQEEIEGECRGLAQEIVKRFLEENIRLVAITDHNGIGTIWNDPEARKNIMDLAAPTWYELIDDEAQTINKEARKTELIILPGVEISTSDIHILAIFPPQRPRRKVHFIICDLLNEIGFDVEEWGKTPEVGKTSVYNTIELIIEKKGIPVIAHADADRGNTNDKDSKALFGLFKMTGRAMRDVLTNKHLPAIEIIDPLIFTKWDKRVEEPLAAWIKKVRKKKGLPPFAYFQGSDAHSLEQIAKRCTYVKMTQPSFAGLNIALHIPSSRVMLYDDFQALREQEKDSGWFIYGIEINHPYFKRQAVRFNRYLNCIVGKLESGKTTLCQLMQKPIESKEHNLEIQGSIKMFIEKIENNRSQYYVIGKDSSTPYLYRLEVNNNKREAREMNWAEMKELGITPRFYHPDIVDGIIETDESLSEFMRELFGSPVEQKIKKFNEMFALPIFLEDKKVQLLNAKATGNTYKLEFNVQWMNEKEEMVQFSELNNSMRRISLICIIIISGIARPLIIDTPEEYFDNQDIADYLLPIINRFKDIRQIILFTNHPLLAINTDPENYILLQRKRNHTRIESGFSIDEKNHKERLINLIEGNPGVFNKRKIRYDLA